MIGAAARRGVVGLASAFAAVAMFARATGCSEAERESRAIADGASDHGDATRDEGPVATMDAATDDGAFGTFGHCCVDDVLLSCFCPGGASCAFGAACADGGCVTGDGSACGGSVDAARE